MTSAKALNATQKRWLTGLAMLTLPIWFVPFAVGLILFGLYSSLHSCIWGDDEHPMGP